MNLQILKFSVLDMLFPRICPACNEVMQLNEKLVCVFCLFKLPFTQFTSSENNDVTKVFKGRLQFHSGNALLYFKQKGISQALMHSVKYDGNIELAMYLGSMFAKRVKELEVNFNNPLVTCVPLHPKKLKQRGYNQSDYIAKGFSKELNFEFMSDLLLRKTFTSTQTKKSRFERWLNLSESIVLNQNRKVEGRDILLMDDVVTTGATIEACGLELLKLKGINLHLFPLCIVIS